MGKHATPQPADEAAQAALPPTDQPGLQAMDAWMLEHPANPRFAPFLLWIVVAVAVPQFLPAILGDSTAAGWLQLPIYTLGIVAVWWMHWRYRKLTPELTLTHHWSVVPSGVFLLVAWVLLGWALAGEWQPRWDALMQGQLLGQLPSNTDTHTFQTYQQQSVALFWSALILRVIGMSLAVPLLEELFSRSLCTRMFSNAKKTGIGFLQVLEDFPLIGDVFIGSKWARKAAGKPAMFLVQMKETPFGVITWFAFAMSTVIFMISHHPRDWPGCIVCSIVWCGMVAWTNRPSLPPEKRLGLGPVIWSHAITNGLLWWYSWGTGDWQFL